MPAAATPGIVSDPSAIDARWLTHALHEAGVLLHGRVVAVKSSMIGHGKMGDNVRYELTYENAPQGAPRSVVAKLPAADPVARNSSAAQGSYWREVSFYREVAPRSEMRVPRAYVSLVDDNRADYVILMEDLAPAEPGDQIDGCGPERAELALREAAKLHGPLCGDRAVEKAEWVVKMTAEGAALGQMVLEGMWPGFVARFADSMSLEGTALGERFVHTFANWALAYDGPRTLVHADYRLENMLFGTNADGATIAVVDWQSCSYSCGLADVAYFLGGGLTIENRRTHERELVELYRRELAGFGVELSEGECWQQYRRSALHGILITVLGSMLSGVDERGDRMFRAMIERHLQHALDMDCAEFLA